MLVSSSTDLPPSSSSSSSFLHLTNSSHDELGQSHLPTFSIRDYAISKRSKNLKKSWPFSSTSLQLCLKHGLSDPLQPVQTHEALSFKKPTVTYKRKKLEKLGCNQTLVKTKEEGLENGGLQVAVVVNKNPRKKIASTTASVERVSKECGFATCPICRAFMSASNTTLNAHIDRCLSLEQPMNKPKRPKVKPRMKFKSIIDVYAAAKRCTLEDLDKRNGTNWSMVSDNKKACGSSREHEDVGEKKSYSKGEGGSKLEGKKLMVPIVRGSTHVSTTDLSKTLNSRNSRRVCGESTQVSGKSTRRSPIPAGKGVMKLSKARLDLSSENEDMGKGKSETTQERELTDYDDNDMFDNKTDDADADTEFESMIYEKASCETTEQGSSSFFMEVDPIPIPGPPGSFLPSPWDHVGTENHGNSSVITSQVHSSQDQLDDLTDRNSPGSNVSTVSNIAATETSSFRNIIRDSDQSCCCPRKKESFEDTTFGQPTPHMTLQQVPLSSKPVLRLMGKDLMVINQREEESSHDESSLEPTLNLSKTQEQSSYFHPLYGGNGLSLGTTTSLYNIQ